MANPENNKNKGKENVESLISGNENEEINDILAKLERSGNTIKGGKELRKERKKQREKLISELKEKGFDYLDKKEEESVIKIEETAGSNPDQKSKEIVDNAKKKARKKVKNFKKNFVIPDNEGGVEEGREEGAKKEVTKEGEGLKNELASEKETEKENLKSLENEMRDLGFNEKILKDKSYENFNKLSTGSKLLVLKNLKAIILSDVSQEAISEAAESTKNKWLAKVFKAKRISGNKKEEELKKLSKDGFDEYKEGKYKEELNYLSGAMSGFEIDVVEKNGKTEVSLLSVEDGMSEKEKTAIKSFNESANKFLNIPKEWAYKSAKQEDRKKYETAKKEYEKVKNDLSELSIDSGNLYDIFSKINKSEWQMRMIRDIKNDSVLKEEWGEAVKNKGFFKKVISNMGNKEKLAYMASGFAIRTVTATIALSVASLPMMMTIGGLRGRRTAKESLRKKDKKDVYKEKADSSVAIQRKKIREEMNSIIPSKFSLNPEAWLKGASAKNNTEYNKLKKTFNELSSKLEKENAQKLNILEAQSLTGKLEALIASYDKEKDSDANSEKLDSILESLNSRIDFTRDKLDKELVNFGSRSSVLNFMSLKRTMEEAKSLVINEKSFGINKDREERVNSLLNSMLDSYNLKLDNVRKKYVRNKVIRGAVTAGAFSALGSVISEFGGMSNILKGDISLDDFGTKVGGIGNVAKGSFSMEDVNLQLEENIRVKMDSVDNMIDKLEGVFKADNVNIPSASQVEISGLEDYVGAPGLEGVISVVDKLSESGINVEGLNEKALESIEGVGELKKVISLEKGGGVSKIFNGHMNNEYQVNFVDGNTGQITEGAAFSKMVHPGDQVMLGEDGEVYVICRKGIQDNLSYGADSNLESVVDSGVSGSENLNPDGEAVKPLSRVEVGGVKLGEDGSVNLETSSVGGVESPVESTADQSLVDNVNETFEEGGINTALEDWDYPEPTGLRGESVVLENGPDKLLISNRDILKDITSLESVDGGYQAVLEDGTEINFELNEHGYFVESSPDLSSVSEVAGDLTGDSVAEGAAEDLAVDNVADVATENAGEDRFEDIFKETSTDDVTGDSVSVTESVSSEIEDSSPQEYSWAENLKDESYDVKVDVQSNSVILNGNKIEFDSSVDLNNIKSIEPVYDGGGGVAKYTVIHENGALETFTAESEGSEIIYTKAGDGVVKLANEINTNESMSNLESLAEKYDWADFLEIGGWTNVTIEGDNAINIDGNILKLPGSFNVDNVELIEPINPSGEIEGFRIRRMDGPPIEISNYETDPVSGEKIFYGANDDISEFLKGRVAQVNEDLVAPQSRGLDYEASSSSESAYSPESQDSGSIESTEDVRTINEADRQGTVKTSKEAGVNEDGQKTTVERQVSSVELRGDMTGAAQNKSNELLNKLVNDDFKNSKSFLKYIEEVKEDVIGNGELSELEKKSWESFFKSASKSSPSALKRSANLRMRSFLATTK